MRNEGASRRMVTMSGDEHNEELDCAALGCVPVDDAPWTCARCDQPIHAEPHTDSDGEDVHADCCESCHPERER